MNFAGLMAEAITGKLARPSVKHENKQALNLLNGVGANQLDFIIGDSDREILAAAPLSLDIFDGGTFDIGFGAGKDALGQDYTLAKIVAIMIVNKSETGVIDLGGDGTAAAWKQLFAGSAAPEDAELRIRPGGTFMIVAPDADGYAVTDVTDHILKIAASVDLKCSILIGGRTS